MEFSSGYRSTSQGTHVESEDIRRLLIIVSRVSYIKYLPYFIDDKSVDPIEIIKILRRFDYSWDSKTLQAMFSSAMHELYPNQSHLLKRVEYTGEKSRPFVLRDETDEEMLQDTEIVTKRIGDISADDDKTIEELVLEAVEEDRLKTKTRGGKEEKYTPDMGGKQDQDNIFTSAYNEISNRYRARGVGQKHELDHFEDTDLDDESYDEEMENKHEKDAGDHQETSRYGNIRPRGVEKETVTRNPTMSTKQDSSFRPTIPTKQDSSFFGEFFNSARRLIQPENHETNKTDGLENDSDIASIISGVSTNDKSLNLEEVSSVDTSNVYEEHIRNDPTTEENQQKILWLKSKMETVLQIENDSYELRRQIMLQLIGRNQKQHGTTGNEIARVIKVPHTDVNRVLFHCLLALGLVKSGRRSKKRVYWITEDVDSTLSMMHPGV
jgi:hypothetical protein